MADHFETVASRLKNMLTRITARDPDFDDLCKKHASLTQEIRSPQADGTQLENLRRRRAALEEQMLTIMSSNTRV